MKIPHIGLVLIGALLLFASCVPNRKLVYLQKDDLTKRKSIPKDTVLRTYSLRINEYKIQPLDILSVSFETLNDEGDAFDFLSKLTPRPTGGGGNVGAGAALSGIVVNSFGEIEYSVLGKIKVGGLNLFEAEQLIKSIANKYVQDVVVRVRMLNFRFTVLGEVNTEQTVLSTNTRLTMMEAIGLAGGLGELADRKHIKVIRQKGDRAEVYYVDLLKEDFLESSHNFVQQNDVIIVPPLKQRPFRKYFTNNLAVITSTISFGLFIITLNQLNND